MQQQKEVEIEIFDGVAASAPPLTRRLLILILIISWCAIGCGQRAGVLRG